MIPDLSREVTVRIFHRRLVLVHPAGIAVPRDRAAGRMGRGGLPRVAGLRPVGADPRAPDRHDQALRVRRGNRLCMAADRDVGVAPGAVFWVETARVRRLHRPDGQGGILVEDVLAERRRQLE